MTPFASSPLQDVVRNPLQLGALYRSCLGERWHSHAEAARYLSARVNAKVDRNSVLFSDTVLSLPQTILTLFRDAGMSMWNARELASARATLGVEKLLEHAATVDPVGMTATQVVRALQGVKPSVDRKLSPTPEPLTLAHDYQQGLENGKWSTTREAAEKLGVNKRCIGEALAISNLPNELKECFTPATLTRRIGLELVLLAQLRKPEALRQAVKEATAVVPRLSEKAFMARLAGIRVEGVELKVRKSKGRFVIELHCDADEDKLDANLHWLNLMAARAVAQIR